MRDTDYTGTSTLSPTRRITLLPNPLTLPQPYPRQAFLHQGSTDFAYKLRDTVERLAIAKAQDFPAMRYLKRRVPPSLLRELDLNAAAAAAHRDPSNARAAAAQNGMLLHIPFWLCTDLYGGAPLASALQRYHHQTMAAAKVFALDPSEPALPTTPLDTDALYEAYRSEGLSALFDLSAPNGAVTLAGAVSEISARFQSLKSMGLPMASAATPEDVREGMLAMALMLQMLAPSQIGAFLGEAEWTSPVLYDYWANDAQRNIKQLVRYLNMSFADDDETVAVAVLPTYAIPLAEKQLLSLGAKRADAPHVADNAVIPNAARDMLRSVLGESRLDAIDAHDAPLATVSAVHDSLRTPLHERQSAASTIIRGASDSAGAAHVRSDLRDYERERLETKQMRSLDPTRHRFDRPT